MSDKRASALLLVLLYLLFRPIGGLAQAQPPPTVTWKDTYYNPKPETGDLLLPMDCGGAMVFRPVEIPSGSWLDDRRVELGHADEARGYKEGRRLSYLAGAFSAEGSKRIYYIAKYETTRDQYAVFAGETCPKPSMRGRLPMTEVTWFDAVEYSRRYTEWLLLNAREQLPSEGREPGFLRLPTEVEWEFAARGGLKVDEADFLAPLFPMPEGDLAQYAWHESTQSAEGRLHPTGLLKPNPVGLYDILGNAAEMTFVPFYLDHRGRPHGQAGGFVTRGGDIFTPPSQIGTAVRQEHNYFTETTGGAKSMDSLGFRLALTAPVIVSAERLAEIKQAWSVLPSLIGGAGAEAEKALKELQDVAMRSQDAALRTKLELIQSHVERAHAAINEARSRTIRALIRTGAFMAKRVVTDQVRVEVLEKVIAQGRKRLDELLLKYGEHADDQGRIAEVIGEIEEKLRKWQDTLINFKSDLANTLSYYGDMVVSVGRDYEGRELENEFRVVAEEMRVKRSDYLIPYGQVFLQHTTAYQKGEATDKEEWLKDLIEIRTP